MSFDCSVPVQVWTRVTAWKSAEPLQCSPPGALPTVADSSLQRALWFRHHLEGCLKMSHANASFQCFEIPISHRSQLPVVQCSWESGNTSSHVSPYSNVPPSRRKSREAGSTGSSCQLYTPQKLPTASFAAAFQAFSTMKVMPSDPLACLFWRFFWVGFFGVFCLVVLVVMVVVWVCFSFSIFFFLVVY